jgi:hypothetical protein
MDADRIWKWAERAAVVVIAPLCAILGAYFAAGTYYGWDKRPEPVAQDHAGGVAMTLPPWLGFALLGIAIVSLLTGWGMIFIRRRANKPNRKRDGSEIAFPDEGKSVSRSYLKEANVYAGSPTSSPELFPGLVASFGRSGRDADICVDFSYFAGGLWIQRRRLLLKNIPSFRRDERAAITILTRDTAENGLVWRWGDAQIKYSNKAEGILGSNRHYRCRIAFIFADETEEYAYFIVETSVGAEMPTAVGRHVFDFVDQWEHV